MEAATDELESGKRQNNEEERPERSLALSLVAGLTTVGLGEFGGSLAEAAASIDPRSVTVEDFMSLPKVRETYPSRVPKPCP